MFNPISNNFTRICVSNQSAPTFRGAPIIIEKMPVKELVEKTANVSIEKLTGIAAALAATVAATATLGQKVKPQQIWYFEDDKTPQWICEYDTKTGMKLKTTRYFEDGKTPNWVIEYDPVTGVKLRDTSYREDGKTKSWMTVYDSEERDTSKCIYYNEDGETVRKIVEYDPKIKHKIVKTTGYEEDGVTVAWIRIGPL